MGHGATHECHARQTSAGHEATHECRARQTSLALALAYFDRDQPQAARAPRPLKTACVPREGRAGSWLNSRGQRVLARIGDLSDLGDLGCLGEIADLGDTDEAGNLSVL